MTIMLMGLVSVWHLGPEARSFAATANVPVGGAHAMTRAATHHRSGRADVSHAPTGKRNGIPLCD